MGFETALRAGQILRRLSVNLPRWGLKHKIKTSHISFLLLCKFTTLGLETLLDIDTRRTRNFGVNLPRWGLKQVLNALDIRLVQV